MAYHDHEMDGRPSECPVNVFLFLGQSTNGCSQSAARVTACLNLLRNSCILFFRLMEVVIHALRWLQLPYQELAEGRITSTCIHVLCKTKPNEKLK